ncbi:MAG: hypothetical protein K2P99_05315, partial [Burkholderiales bacterium]|nr:hypothetical protein [Burkholderiales bacterium]
ILEFIEKNNIQFLEKFIAISANKLSSSHVYEIIKQAIRINNDEILTFILEKLSSNLDTYYAKKLMEELIAAKNTELLNLVTDKLTDIIKSNTIMGDYHLEKLFEKAIASNEPQITKLITTALVGKIKLEQIINYIIREKNEIFFSQHIVNLDKFTVSFHIFKAVKIAIGGKGIAEESEIRFIGEKLIPHINKYISVGYDAHIIKALDLIADLKNNKVISAEVKSYYAKLILSLKSIAESEDTLLKVIDSFEEEFLNINENGVSLMYHLLGLPSLPKVKQFILSKIYTNTLNGYNITLKEQYMHHTNSSYKHTVVLLQGNDHNNALSENLLSCFFAKNTNIYNFDFRVSKSQIFDYDIFKEVVLSSNLLFLHTHGSMGYLEHNVTIDSANVIATHKLFEKIYGQEINTPIKVILSSCSGQAALADSIKILPSGSEMLTFSEYRDKMEYISDIKNTSIVLHNFLAEFESRRDLKFDLGIELHDIAYTIISGYNNKVYTEKPSPAYAKKDKDGNIKMFSCIEKLEDLIEGKIDLSNVKKLQQSFVLKYCGYEDVECINKASSVIEKTLDSIEHMHTGHQVEEVSKKLLDRSTDDFNVNLALGCQIGFSEINGDFEE